MQFTTQTPPPRFPKSLSAGFRPVYSVSAKIYVDIWCMFTTIDRSVCGCMRTPLRHLAVPGPGCTNGRKCCRKVKSKNVLHHRCLTTCPNCLVLRTALTCGVSQVWCNPKRLLQNRCTNTTYDRGLRQKATCSGR